jgi:hypothetical protein
MIELQHFPARLGAVSPQALRAGRAEEACAVGCSGAAACVPVLRLSVYAGVVFHLR